MISPTTSNQRNKVEKQVETKVTDDKVVSVCKQTITYAIQKVVIGENFQLPIYLHIIE